MEEERGVERLIPFGVGEVGRERERDRDRERSEEEKGRKMERVYMTDNETNEANPI